MDAKLRDLEKAARRGGDAEKAAYLSAMERAGRLPLDHLQWAAMLAHQPSRLLFPGAVFRRGPDLEAIHHALMALPDDDRCNFILDLLIFEAENLPHPTRSEESLLARLRDTRNSLTKGNVRYLWDIANSTPSVLTPAVMSFCDLWLLNRPGEAASRAYISLSDVYWDNARREAFEAEEAAEEGGGMGAVGDWSAHTRYRVRIEENVLPILFRHLLPEAGV